MNKKTILLVVVALILSSSVFLFGYSKVTSPKEVYKVYLDGEVIGLIDSSEALEAYIDQEQNEIKDQYGVDKVYLPNNLDIEKVTTYSNNISTVEEIYEKIKDIAPFTISGYEIKIKGVEEYTVDTIETTKTVTLYVLDQDVFVDSVETTIKAFIDEEDYENFVNDLQKEIEDTGSIIENIYIQNDITIKETNVSVEEKIYTDTDELSQFLLFGTLNEQENYTVKSGDTIEDIAFANKMSTNEFLVANPDITSVDNLLYAGQVVNIGLIDPAFKVIEEDYVVEYQKIEYSVTYEYDSTLVSGTEQVKQEGVNGKAKVSYTVTKSNGDILSTETQSTETITQAQNKIVIKGTKVVSGVGVSVSGTWYWPTDKPYTITSSYGYRSGKLHEGVDIQSSGGRNIYAANNGVVVQSSYTSINGNYITIDHKNGYYTMYAHLASRSVSVGDTVEMGQKIGVMGATGLATGVHLHFALWKGFPYRDGVSYNPIKVLKFQ